MLRKFIKIMLNYWHFAKVVYRCLSDVHRNLVQIRRIERIIESCRNVLIRFLNVSIDNLVKLRDYGSNTRKRSLEMSQNAYLQASIVLSLLFPLRGERRSMMKYGAQVRRFLV